MSEPIRPSHGPPRRSVVSAVRNILPSDVPPSRAQIIAPRIVPTDAPPPILARTRVEILPTVVPLNQPNEGVFASLLEDERSATVAPPSEPRSTSPVATIRDQLIADLDDAASRKDMIALARAVRVAVAVGIRNEHTTEVFKLQDRKSRAKFARTIAAAKKALERMRDSKSVADFEDAEDKLFGTHLKSALSCDRKGRRLDELLRMIGTSEREVDRLPYLFYSTLTAVPSVEGNIGTFESRRPLRRGRAAPIVSETIINDGKRCLPVTYLSRPQAESAEVVRIADSQTIKPRPVRYESHNRPVLFKESEVVEPLFVFIIDVNDQRFAYAAVLLRNGFPIVYEVPWSDAVLEGKLIELVRPLRWSAEPKGVEPFNPVIASSATRNMQAPVYTNQSRKSELL